MKSISIAIFASIMFTSLGGCAGAQQSPFGPPNPGAPTTPPTQAEISQARSAVISQLIDPTSPIFSTVVFVRQQSSQGPIFCGMVNSKNRFGGYTGGQPFFVAVGVPIINSFNFNTIGFQRFKEAMVGACSVSQQLPVPNF